ncbi:hypothetical protein [Cytobacillus praedii]|uniref:hypothetical protein n=1 Tax=Cytobacillus praedii TaxID=1742358 RepID=UPI002E243F75|nr:hypothetical protein [Cytobacillus praedii]
MDKFSVESLFGVVKYFLALKVALAAEGGCDERISAKAYLSSPLQDSLFGEFS